MQQTNNKSNTSVVSLLSHPKFVLQSGHNDDHPYPQSPLLSAPKPDFVDYDNSIKAGAKYMGIRQARYDPKGNVLPAGIRYVNGRPNNPYRVEQEVQESDGSWRSTSKTFPTLALAKKGLHALKVDIANGNPPTGKTGKISLADFRDKVRANTVAADLSPSTMKDYERAWNLRIEPELGKYRLHLISTDLIEESMNEWLETATPSTVCSALSYLSQLLDKARAQKRIITNPMSGLKRPKSITTSHISERALTEVQQAALLVIMQNVEPVYDRFIQTLLHTGLRFSEATALRAGDVDLATSRLWVTRAFQSNGSGALSIGPTKGKKYRTAPVTAALRPALEAAMTGKKDHELLFTTHGGSVIRGSNLRRQLHWDSIRKQIGKAEFCFHDLRHTAATNMLASVPPQDVRAILGHYDLATTNIYAGSQPDYASRAANLIDSFVASVNTSTTTN